MKVSRLLVLSALWLTGLGVNAADLIERTAPTNADVPQTAVAFEADHQYLLYNTGKGEFFSQGGAWGTKACSCPEVEYANRMYFTKYVPEGDEWDGFTYIFKIYSTIRSNNYAWHECFFDSDVAMFVDRGSQGNYFWEIEDKGGNTYRLYSAAINPSVAADGMFVGCPNDAVADDANLDSNREYGTVVPISPKTEENVDWVFYDAIVFQVYEAAESLKAKITEAEAAGVDVSAAAAVYNNLNATLEQINDAISALTDAMSSNIKNATGHNPQDASAWIVNGTFDTIGDFHGWEGTGFGAGGTTSTNAENYNKNYDTYQDITVLYPGLYAVQVNGFYRAGSIAAAYEHFVAGDEESKYARLYVNIDGEEKEIPIASIYEGALTSKPEHGAGTSANGFWIPNSMADTEKYMHQNGLYKNMLPIEITGSEVPVRIGVRKDVTLDTDWSIFDDFSLTFFGAGDDRFYGLAKLVADGVADVNVNDVIATESYVSAFKSLKENPAGNNEEEVMAYKEQLTSARATLVKNIQLWKELEAAWNKAQADILNNASKFDQNSESYIWLEDGKYDFDNLSSYTKTNEEIEEEIAKINDMITDCLQHTQGNVDVTGLMKNPDFSTNDWTGWTREAVSGGNVQVSYNCAEAWNNAGFDIYQVVENAPAGVYRIQVQGFYRYLRGDNAWNNRNVYGKGKEKEVPCYVYMNSKATPFMNIFEEKITDSGIFTSSTDFNTFTDDEDGNTYYAPNNMATASDAFASPSTVEGMEEFNMYTQVAWGLVARTGDPMRIGVKGISNQGGDSWVIFDNFQLMRMEPTADVVQPVLTDEIANANDLLSKAMGKSQKNALREAVKAASAAVGGSDGQAMFDALQALFEAEDNCSASIEKFQAVEDAKKRLAIANEDAVTKLDAEVAAMMNELDAALTEGTIEDEDVDALVARVDALIVRLNTPDYTNASDSDPADFSGLIKNANYAENNQDGWTAELEKQDDGDTNYRAADGVGEVFSQNYLYYQDLSSLPAGTYGLSVQAFYRAGNAEEDWATKDDGSYNNAFLFATTTEGDYAKTVARLASEPNSNDSETLTEGYAWAQKFVEATEENPESVDGFEVANGTGTAATEFSSDKYHNSIILKVAEDGVLRLGLRKSSWIKNDWTCFTNWQLWYYGANSSRTPDTAGVSEMSTNNNVQKVEYFTVDGRRANVAHKGLVIMKQTMTNGNVVVKKINK
jgi:hypothetical protein